MLCAKAALAKISVALGQSSPCKADRGNAEGRIVDMSEKFGLHIRTGMRAQVIRLEFHFPEFGGVFMQVDVFVAAAVQVFKSKARDALPGAFAQVVNGWVVWIVGHETVVDGRR